jgi:hypothetical protein
MQLKQQDSDQQLAISPRSLTDEWLPEDHLARFIIEMVYQLDLSKLTRH